MGDAEKKEITRLFSSILDYPTDDILENVAECCSLLQEVVPMSADQLEQFSNGLTALTRGLQEELYAQTFDFNPSTSLYAGYHLFGDNYHRSKFLVQMRACYKDSGFEETTRELPDHIPVILRCLASTSLETPESQQIIKDSLLPALSKVEKNLARDKNAYGSCVQALRGFLKKISHENE